VSGRRRPLVVPPGEGPRVANVEFLARSQDTELFNLFVVELAPMQGVDEHTHRAEVDAFYVLEGDLTVTLEGSEVVAGPGTFVLVPPGTAHWFVNNGDSRVRLLNVHAPAGFDRRLAAAG
jgi:quercetin dioxygenase-like cupin family protein